MTTDWVPPTVAFEGLGLLPWETALARRIAARNERRGLNATQLRLVGKNGTRGLVLLAVFAGECFLLALAVWAGMAWLFVSHGSSGAYWLMCIAGALGVYVVGRAIQIGRLRPDDVDLDFLRRAGRTD
jgi:hypothetical protein